MNSLYTILKNANYTQSEDQMWKTVKKISDFLDDKLSDEDKNCLNRCVYGILSKGHYNEQFAKEDIDNMKMSDGSDIKFIGLDIANVWFGEERLPSEYNVYDFWVTCNMLLTDNYGMLKSWFPNDTDDQIMQKVRQSAVNWLNDEDNPFGTSKIWCYFNSKK